MIDRGLNEIFNNAIKFAKEQKHEYLTLEHVFLSLLSHREGVEILKACGANVDHIRNKVIRYLNDNLKKYDGEMNFEPFETLALSRVIESMIRHTQSSEKKESTVGDFLAAMFEEEHSFSTYLLKQNGITKLDIIEYITETTHPIEAPPIKTPEIKTKEEESFLEKFSINLTQLAKDGKIDPVIGRELETERMMEVLCRRKKIIQS